MIKAILLYEFRDAPAPGNSKPASGEGKEKLPIQVKNEPVNPGPVGRVVGPSPAPA